MTLMSLTSGAGPAPELSTSAAAVLGMLSLGARTGYDIQKAAEVSLRFFWAVSPAQVYGELRRLEDAGMIAGADDGRGARRRRSYTLTAAGHRTLTTWLTGPDSSPLEIRDQTLLRLFFAAAVTPRQADQILSDAHRRSAAMIADFDARILPAARRHEREHGDPFPRLAAECGRALHGAIADWTTAARARLGDPS
jgi:DNA-binding PadR family transcriptional regulator